MSSNYRILWALRIDGVQDTPLAKIGGLWFTQGKWGPPAKSGYVWVDALTRVPEFMDEIDKNTGEFRSGPVVFGVSASDRVAEMFESFVVDPVGIVAGGGLDLTDTELFLEGGLTLGTGLYWIGDEVVEVWGATGSASAIIRARAGTVAGYHDIGDPVTVVPLEWKGLGVTLAIVDVFGDYSGTVGAVVEVWKGYVEEIEDGLSEYSIRAIGDWTYHRSAETNKKPRDWSASGEFFRSGEVTWGTVDRPGLNDASGVLVRSIAVQGYAAQLNNAVVLGRLIGNQVFFQAQPGAIRGASDWYKPVRLGTSEFMDIDTSLETVSFPGPVWELAVIDRIGDRGDKKISCTQALEHPYHPLSLCLALLVSDGSADISNFKIFQAQYGLGLVNVDIAAWKTMIDETPEFDEALDQWVGGWDGKPVKVIDEVRKICKAFGFMPVRDYDCKIRVRRIEDLTLASAKFASDNAVIPYRDSSFSRTRNLSHKAGRVFAKVGGLPWREGVSVEVITGAARRRIQGVDNPVDLDLSMIQRGNALVMAERLASNAVLANFPAPELVVRVENRAASSSVPYELLQYVALADMPIQSAWWVDKQGVRRADVAGVVDLFGQIVGRKMLNSLAYELRLVFTAFRTGRYARERAPALFVDYAADAVIHVIDIGMGTPADFEVGEEVEFWTFLGEVWVTAGLREIVSIGATTITLNAIPGDGVNCTIVRAARSMNFTSPKYDLFDDRRFVFAADSAGEVERPLGAEDADIFGGRLGSGGTGGFIAYEDHAGFASPPAIGEVRRYQYLDDAVVEIDALAGSPPVDMFLLWRILRNLARLASSGSHIHKRELVPYAGLAANKDAEKQRCYASLEPMTVFSIPWLCQRGLQKLRTRTVLLIGRADAVNTAEMNFTVELLGVRERSFSLGATYNPAVFYDDWSDQDWDLEFDPVEAEFVTDLTLWASSGNYSASLATVFSASYAAGNRLKASDVGSYIATNDQDPVQTTNLTLCCYYESDGGTLFDTLGMRTFTEIRVRPLGGTQPSGPIGSVTRRAISYLQTKGWDLSEVFDPGAWVPSPYTFKAADTVNASDDAMIATSRRQLDKRKRCVWIGPTGRTVVPERGMPPNHHERFERVRSNSAGTWKHWFTADISADQPTSEYLALVNFIPVLESAQVRSDGTLGGLRDLATSATWEVRCWLEEFDGGFWALETAEIEVEHYPTDITSPFLALQNEACRRLNATWTIAEAFSSGSLHAIKEGRLSRQDLALVHRMRMKIRAGNYGSIEACRIRFEARVKSGTAIYRQALAADMDSRLEGGLTLVCTGATIWENIAYSNEVEFV